MIMMRREEEGVDDGDDGVNEDGGVHDDICPDFNDGAHDDVHDGVQTTI